MTAGTYSINRPLPPPIFSLPSGTYAAPQSITLTADPSYCAHATCAIYYTLDGSTPTTGSIKYVNSIVLSAAGTATIKALGTSHHFTSSRVAMAAYTIQ